MSIEVAAVLIDVETAQPERGRMRGMVFVGAALIAACGGDETTVEVDAGVVVLALDAREQDGPRGPDAAPSDCPHVEVGPVQPAGSPPTGGDVHVAWICIGGCATHPAPAITAATRLDMTSGGQLRWKNGGTLIVATQALRSGNCWRVPADNLTECRAAYDLCSGPRIAVASWFDVNTNWRQTWEMVPAP